MVGVASAVNVVWKERLASVASAEILEVFPRGTLDLPDGK